MCLQRVADSHVKGVIYGCNSCTINILDVNHVLDTLVSHTSNSCILSNKTSTFELYTPTIDIDKLLNCFNCAEKVTLDNILTGVGGIINNSFNTNYNSNNNSNNTNTSNTCCEESKQLETKQNTVVLEQLDRIEQEVIKRNTAEYTFLPFIIMLAIAFLLIVYLIYKLQLY